MKKEVEYQVSGGILSVYGIDFFGSCKTSENRRFILGWSATHEGPPGNVLLIETGKIIKGVTVRYPLLGKVSNTGVFVIINEPFSNRLTSDVLVYRSSGEILMSYRVNANIFTFEISPTGRYVVWQTAENPASKDGDKLFFLDVAEKVNWAKESKTRWPGAYRIDENNRVFTLLYGKGRQYRYSFNGEFLDANKWESDMLNSDKGYEVLKAVETKLDSGQIGVNEFPDLINYLEVVLKKDTDPGIRSLICRRIGEFYYEMEDRVHAKDFLEKALKLNPKVGVKRILHKIKKELE